MELKPPAVAWKLIIEYNLGPTFKHGRKFGMAGDRLKLWLSEVQRPEGGWERGAWAMERKWVAPLMEAKKEWVRQDYVRLTTTQVLALL